jgi:TfoX/Sxy family transcriptional regulator of competence genes
VAYDEDLADRIRSIIGADPDVTQKKMFGGLAFLVGGNMAIAASAEGGAMVRVDPQDGDSLIASTPATIVVMRGREMPGWLRIESDHLTADGDLAEWVGRGTSYARSLPAKR